MKNQTKVAHPVENYFMLQVEVFCGMTKCSVVVEYQQF
jgi:hypothetical protein